jgi:pyruvate dehydrogenase E2 component (dihydrolipoamide acetyltransferase)
VQREPVVDGDAIVPGQVLRVFATFDHRVLDGMHAAKMAKTLTHLFDDPVAGFGPLPPVPPASA